MNRDLMATTLGSNKCGVQMLIANTAVQWRGSANVVLFHYFEDAPDTDAISVVSQ